MKKYRVVRKFNGFYDASTVEASSAEEAVKVDSEKRKRYKKADPLVHLPIPKFEVVKVYEMVEVDESQWKHACN